MTIIAVCPTLGLSEHYGTAPVWWQLFKALYELEVDTLAVPLFGSSVETVWWKSEKGPFYSWNCINRLPVIRRSQLLFTRSFKNAWWKWFVRKIKSERHVNVILWLSTPIHILKGFPTFIRRVAGVPCLYYDADAPRSLPQYDRYSQYEKDCDLSEFEAILIPSKGCAQQFKEMGANKVYTIYFGVDPMLYRPVKVLQDIDVSFYGRNDLGREDFVKYMLSIPAEKMSNRTFVFGGGGTYRVNLDHLHDVGEVPFSRFRRFCCRSRINLNIARKAFAEIYASSISRPFELASLSSCIVSNPCKGMSEWFELGKEIFVANNLKETLEIYDWLLTSEDVRLKAGELARKRVLREHSYAHRAKQLISLIHF